MVCDRFDCCWEIDIVVRFSLCMIRKLVQRRGSWLRFGDAWYCGCDTVDLKCCALFGELN